MNKNVKIALFFGGKISKHLVMVRAAARKLGVALDLVSYNKVSFDTVSGKVKLNDQNINDYDVLFFRTTGKHWEEVNLILDAAKNPSKSLLSEDLGTPDKGDFKTPIIVDPLVEKGRPSDACKAYQMLALKKAGIDVPKTLYGSLFYLRDMMKNPSVSSNSTSPLEKRENSFLDFPIIIKGSGGDRGTRVFKADNMEELEKLVMSLRKSEVSEGKRYMAQEYIPNNGDFRVLVLGDKVLGVMKRSSQSEEEFKNNYSVGGKVEVADLPEEVKQLAIKAASVCGLWVAGVDVAFRDYDLKKPVIWEVNKGPQFRGFMEATKIDVPAEMIKFLVSLKK